MSVQFRFSNRKTQNCRGKIIEFSFFLFLGWFWLLEIFEIPPSVVRSGDTLAQMTKKTSRGAVYMRVSCSFLFLFFLSASNRSNYNSQSHIMLSENVHVVRVRRLNETKCNPTDSKSAQIRFLFHCNCYVLHYHFMNYVCMLLAEWSRRAEM